MRARTAVKLVESESAVTNRWRRRAFAMAHRAIEDYRAQVRDEVLRAAEQLRQEAARNPGHPRIAEDLVTRLAHHVVRIAPPLPRVEGEYERIGPEEPGEPRASGGVGRA